nr:AMP-binding protein [uncultured Blautia sp.]
MNFTEQNLTGKASIDKPWLNFYPEGLRNLDVPKITIESFLKMKNPDENKIAFEYYGNKITWKQLWAEVDIAARALKALGFEEGDRVPSFMVSTPAQYILLLAAERVGVAVICRDDEPEELCYAIRKSRTDTVFAMDYVSKEDEELFRETTPMTRMIKVSPFEYADKSQMKDYVLKEIESRCAAETETAENDMSWQEFMDLGRNFEGEYLAPVDPERAVFGAYTSGSTGISKLVIHSSANVVAIAYQMSIFIPPSDVQEVWWTPILPPALIAVTVSMTIFPLSTGLMVSLDPFCPLEEIDVEFMDRKPNFWALIPLYCDMLMESKRIPEDYDMSHLRTIGAGAEAMNDRKYAEVEAFFHKHNVKAKFSAGYGQSEGCSNFTLPNPMFPLEDGCVGMPMPATVLAVFDKDLNELNYGESGELCMMGPSMMLHYSGWRGEEMTEKTLVEHPDGNTWLHTGDEAYITEQGIIHILGRGDIKCYGDKPLHIMRMETKTVRTPGVQDGFFCVVPDLEHEGYFRPYLFVILDGTKTLEEVSELLKDTLEEHEYPVEIRVITERPYFHFKTNRKELTAQILEELKQAE